MKNNDIDKLEKQIIVLKRDKKNVDIELSTVRKELSMQTKRK